MSSLCRIARIAPAALALSLASAGSAQSIPCGEPYVVHRGDTLQRIAERAYGPEASFRDLIEDNLQFFIGGDPSRIAVGQALTIPCRPETADPSAEAPEPRLAAAPAGPALLALAQSDGTDATELIARLAEQAGIAPAIETPSPVQAAGLIAVLDETPQPLIADALPRPACDASGIDATAQALCSRLAWSAPVAEYVLATFTLSDAGPVTRNEGLRGQRLCMPTPLPVYLLAARGLIPPAAELQQPGDVAACFTALRAGSVDAVIAPAILADEAVARLGPGAAITEQFALAQLVTLHSAALADDAAARDALSRLDDALLAAKRSAAARLRNLPD